MLQQYNPKYYHQDIQVLHYQPTSKANSLQDEVQLVRAFRSLIVQPIDQDDLHMIYEHNIAGRGQEIALCRANHSAVECDEHHQVKSPYYLNSTD